MQIITVDTKRKPKVREITDDYFDTKIYNNSGILDEEIIGFMRFGLHDDFAILEQIYVHPDKRRDGIGTILLEAFEEHAKNKKKKQIRVFSFKDAGDPFGDFLINKQFIKGENRLWTKSI